MRNSVLYNYFLDYSDAVHKNGYHVIPVRAGSKHPALGAEWRTYCWKKPDKDRVLEWTTTSANLGLGLACGRGCIAIDIDADDPETAKGIKTVAKEFFGETPLERQGRKPRSALIYRPSEPILSRRLRSVDTIGLGAQLVAYGIHPKTGAAYSWVGEHSPATIPVTELPMVSNEMIEAFYRKIAKDVFKCNQAKGRLRCDKVNFTPPLSSIGVMTCLLLRSVLLGSENARLNASRILADKYGDTGTGLGIDLLAENQDLDF